MNHEQVKVHESGSVTPARGGNLIVVVSHSTHFLGPVVIFTSCLYDEMVMVVFIHPLLSH